MNSDGERPSIAVVGERQLKPSEPVLIMNPFQRLEGALEAAELVFDFKLYGKENITHTSITLHLTSMGPSLRQPSDADPDRSPWSNAANGRRVHVPMTLAATTRLGPCGFVALLGTGGMGEVYRARDTRLGRESRSRCSGKTSPAQTTGDDVSGGRRRPSRDLHIRTCAPCSTWGSKARSTIW